ncbi:MAG: flagellar protein FliT [Idiomarina sp.]|nr:flagellar protein FliT [Idiomarina sp.]
MSELVAQAQVLEAEFLGLLEAEELDDERLGAVVERRNAHLEAMGAAMDENPELTQAFKPVFEQALQNTRKLQARCEQERDDVQKKLITLNTSKKARKAY